MKFTLRDKLALIYTSAGSLRSVAALVGVSHQKIGRTLHSPEMGGYKATSRVLADPDYSALVDQAFKLHVMVARQQARADGLPFDPDLPIYARRLPFINKSTGEVEPGLRVLAEHTHWLSNEIRDLWIQFEQRTKIFNNVAIGSFVDLAIYFARAEERFKQLARDGVYRTKEQEKHRAQLENRLALRIERSWIYTQRTPLDGIPFSQVKRALERILKAKHEPAASDAKTRIADQIILQIKSRHEIAKRKGKKPRKRSR